MKLEDGNVASLLLDLGNGTFGSHLCSWRIKTNFMAGIFKTREAGVETNCKEIRLSETVKTCDNHCIQIYPAIGGTDCSYRPSHKINKLSRSEGTQYSILESIQDQTISTDEESASIIRVEKLDWRDSLENPSLIRSVVARKENDFGLDVRGTAFQVHT